MAHKLPHKLGIKIRQLNDPEQQLETALSSIASATIKENHFRPATHWMTLSILA
jgi:hypothetical protein